MKPHYASLLLACIAAGCYPKTPGIPEINNMPTKWKAPLSTASNDVSHLDITQDQLFNTSNFRWWEVYNNHDLNKLTQEALTSNFSLKSYFARIEVACAQSGIALSDLYPHITVEASAERARIAKSKRLNTPVVTGIKGSYPNPFPLIFPPPVPTMAPKIQNKSGPHFNNDLNIGMLFSYEIDLWGKYNMAYDASKERITESQEDYRSARLSLCANIADYFFRTLYYTSKLTLIDQRLEALKQLLNIASDSFTQGLDSEDPLMSAKTRFDAAIIEKDTLLQQRAQVENQLAVFAGMPPEEFSPPTYPLSFQPPALPKEISSTLLLNRPDILALRSEVKARALEVGVAKADQFPSLTLGAGMGYESTKADTLFKWKNHIWSLASSLSYDLFDAGKKSSAIEQNKALFKEVLFQYQNRILEALKEVEDALFSLQESQKNLEIQKQRYLQTMEKKNLAQARYTSGLAPKSQYLEAYIDLLFEEQNYKERQLSYLQASIALYTALGGNWIIDPSQTRNSLNIHQQSSVESSI